MKPPCLTKGARGDRSKDFAKSAKSAATSRVTIMPTQSPTPNRKLITQTRTHRGKYFTEKLDDNIGLDMMLIPSGSFMMGQSEADKKGLIRTMGEEIYQEFFLYELPQHSVPDISQISRT
jgi:formylglycine-generating enzyme required for sulfatase activity